MRDVNSTVRYLPAAQRVGMHASVQICQRVFQQASDPKGRTNWLAGCPDGRAEKRRVRFFFFFRAWPQHPLEVALSKLLKRLLPPPIPSTCFPRENIRRQALKPRGSQPSSEQREIKQKIRCYRCRRRLKAALPRRQKKDAQYVPQTRFS